MFKMQYKAIVLQLTYYENQLSNNKYIFMENLDNFCTILYEILILSI